MSSQDLVNGYMQMVKDNPQTNNTEVDVNTAEINKIQTLLVVKLNTII